MNKPIWESSILRTRSSQSRLRAKLKQRFKSSFSKTQGKANKIYCGNHSKKFVFETQKAQNRLEANFIFKTFDGLSDWSFNLDEKSSPENSDREPGKEKKSEFAVHTFARPNRLVAIKGKETKKFLNFQETPRKVVRLGMTGFKFVKGSKGRKEVEKKCKARDEFLEIVSMRVGRRGK